MEFANETPRPRPQDILAGLLFVAFGLLGVWLARALAGRNRKRHGAGYFPRLVCGLLIAIGALLGDRLAVHARRASRTGDVAADLIHHALRARIRIPPQAAGPGPDARDQHVLSSVAASLAAVALVLLCGFLIAAVSRNFLSP